MSAESSFIEQLRALATHEAARGLVDDAAVLSPPLGRDLVFTHDVLVENVHYLAGDPPGDVAWQLIAVNLSDLAAKGARPVGVLLGFTLSEDREWNQAFIAGLGRALKHFDVALLGGDTVSGSGQRVLGLTAIGQVAAGGAPSRSSALPGDDLWVTGAIGDGGLGLQVALGRLASGEAEAERRLLKRYRLPMPRLAFGSAVAPHVRAMMDVSDGLLIDARRMAAASNVAIAVRLNDVPLSADAIAVAGQGRDARLAAATAGDDYELLFAAAPSCRSAIKTLAEQCRVTVTMIGDVQAGNDINICDKEGMIDIPEVLGWEHHLS